MADIDPEDIAAVRREDGGLRALMRAQIAIGQARRVAPPTVRPPKPPGYRPGAWPSGTQPPGPLPSQPPGAWAAALDRHRDGSNAESDPCHCGGCLPPDQPEENP